jgi:hypothetical protein
MNGRHARDAILASGGHWMAPYMAEKVITFVVASRGRAEDEAGGETESSRGSKSSQPCSGSEL